MRTETVGSVHEFLHGKATESFSAKIERHFKKYGFVYKVAGVTVIILATGGTALANTGIDVGAKKLYYELANIGRWIIIFKGGIDTVKAIADGDHGAAKKSFISSLLLYLMLLGLPYGMDKVDDIFRSVTAGNM